MSVAAWEVVIGLEIHAQLATKSKIFSGASTAYGAEANTHASLVDLGYPGVLPVLNAEVVRMATLFGLAVNATVAPRSVFARKNYFYPDLPKGYQISQYELPIVEHGEMFITDADGQAKRIRITRAHLEEDAGKSIHEGLDASSGIDLNRAGTPLLEIVSEPDLRSAKEAIAYMKKIHTIVRYLGISDGNMQEGTFRCDANVSVRPRGQDCYDQYATVWLALQVIESGLECVHIARARGIDIECLHHQLAFIARQTVEDATCHRWCYRHRTGRAANQ